MAQPNFKSDVEAVDALAKAYQALRAEIGKVIVGQEDVVKNVLTPKTQAALLEAMQERSVTVNGVRHLLPSPFFVLATQNPIEQEGTYPLPEAQLDRFMFNIPLDYPTYEQELAVVKGTTGVSKAELNTILLGIRELETRELGISF